MSVDVLNYIKECSGEKTSQNLYLTSRVPSPKVSIRPEWSHSTSGFNGWILTITSTIPEHTHELIIKIPKEDIFNHKISVTEIEQQIVTTKHKLSAE